MSEARFDPHARPKVVGSLARFVLGVFFRRVEVVGAENLPRDRPLLIVANHVNSLIDPALLIGYLPVEPRFLAKSTLWSMAAVKPFLGLAAAIPVYRRQDPGVDPSQNAKTFEACHEVLRAGGTIALFPEGRSHNEPALVPLKTGVSRIVLQAESRFGGLGTRIVPVGLTFEEKGRFRSRALVHVGEALDPAPELAIYADDERQAVGALTERVREALSDVTLNFPSWDTARLIERAAELYARPRAGLPAEAGLAERFPLRQTFIEGYEALNARCPEEVAAVAEAVEGYDAALEAARLDDVQVAAAYPTAGVARFVAKSLFLLAFRAPLALIGTVMNYLPYWAVGRVARRFEASPDLPATYKLFASLALFPLTWILWALAAGWPLGWLSGLAVLAVGPGSAYFALRYHERRRYFRRHVRAYLLLRSGRPMIEELRKRRREVLAAVERLAKVYQAASGDGAAAGAGAGDPGSVASPRSEVQ